MAVSRVSKSALLRATALAGIVGLGGLSTSSALAATLNSLTFNSVQSVGPECVMQFSYDITGVDNDANFEDRFILVADNALGQLGVSPSNTSQRFVATGTNLVQSDTAGLNQVVASNQGLALQLFDTDQTFTNTTTGPLGFFIVPNADLRAAGGACGLFAANNAPTADAGPDASTNRGTSVTLDGTGSFDPDNDPITYNWQVINAPSNFWVLPNPNSPTTAFLVAPGGAPGVYTLELTVDDGFGGIDTDTVNITVGNQAPTAQAGPNQNVTGGTTVSLSGTASDPNGDPLSFQWTQLNGPPVTIDNSNSANSSFIAPAPAANAQTLELQFVADDGDATGSDTLIINVAANLAPTADIQGPVAPVAGGSTVTLDGSGSTDPEGQALTYQWQQISGPAVTFSGQGTDQITFTAPPSPGTPLGVAFRLTVTDPVGANNNTDFGITIAVNQAPIAQAQTPANVLGGQSAPLDGTLSTDPDGDPLTYQWTQLSGPPVTITNPTSPQASYVAPATAVNAQLLEFQLTVTDTFGASDSTILRPTVRANQSPVADIQGPTGQVAGGASVILDGSGSSDPEGQPLVYQWTQISGPTVAFSGQGTAQISYTAPASTGSAQPIEFQLTVADPLDAADIADFTVTVAANNTPVANAGPAQTVTAGGTAQLDGSASLDPDGDPITYQWTQVSGPTVAFSDSTLVNPSVTIPAATRAAQTISLSLVVNDGSASSAPALVDLTIPGNAAPTADAGQATTVNGGTTVSLDATGSTDPEGDALTFAWTQISGSSVGLSNANSATPTFTAPTAMGSAQPIVFEVLVSDGVTGTPGPSQTAQVTITVSANRPPVADASNDQSVRGGDAVTLDGSGSTDPDGDTLSYTWTQISGPAVTLSDANAVSPTFTAPVATTNDQGIVFSLSVSDGADTASDEVTITILANRPPVADAGADQGPIDAGQTVTLDGSASSDPDGDALSFNWVQTGGPAVTLSDPNAAQPTFVAPSSSSTVSFDLTVSDGVASATDSVSIEVRAVGTITIVQRLAGSDTQVNFTSNLAALSTAITTVNGVGQITAQSVPIGVYTVTAADLSSQGIVVTEVTCSDTDSVGNAATRTATIDLTAGEDVTCTFSAANSREAAQVAIYNYLTGRNALLLANQPDLQRRIDRLSDAGMNGQGGLNAYGISVPGAERLPLQATVTPGQTRVSSSLDMALGSTKDRLFDIWTEAYFSDATIGSQDASFSVVHIGADVKISDSLLLGAILQLDDFEDKGSLEVGEGQGDGYLVGPYITARLAPQLFVEARAAWGSSDNLISPLPGQVDGFETSRSLYSGSVVGQLDIGKRTVFRPEFTVRYLSEDQKAYTDSLGIPIPSQTVDQGDISLRPRLSHIIKSSGSLQFRPFAELEGIYTFGTEPDAALANLLAGTFADTFGRFRGRVQAGLDLMGKGTFRASVSGFYDGIGASSFSNEGVQLGVSFGF
ncbi:MAG: PKD domain-containing protein [Pseudomonadota bacterium]